jgi:hypothetical protein
MSLNSWVSRHPPVSCQRQSTSVDAMAPEHIETSLGLALSILAIAFCLKHVTRLIFINIIQFLVFGI